MGSPKLRVSYNKYPNTGSSLFSGQLSGLGSYNRTAGAVILGGPRAGAGSAVRIYNYLTTAGRINANLANFKKILRAQYYNVSLSSRNYSLGW
jgi:hypothetical protein